MLIKDIKEPIVFIALKRISNYLIYNVWPLDLLGDDLVEAEFKLAVVKSKEYKDVIEILAKIDADLNWGQRKAFVDEKHWSISKVGDFNPWYDGGLSLEDLLNSIESIVDFETSGDHAIQYSEFQYYYNFLCEFCGQNKTQSSIEFYVSKIKKIMTDVSTGLARIQDEDSEYQNLYTKLSEHYRSRGIKNPNEFSDLWEFYAYWKKHLSSYAERRAYIAKIYKILPETTRSTPAIKSGSRSYINIDRIDEIPAAYAAGLL